MSARSLATGEEIRVILLSVVLFAAAALAPAQTTNGTFHGTVADTSGAVVPYATVQVKNLATGAARQATTSDVGFYTVPQIPPGHYSITVSKTGFATAVQPDVDLLVNQDLEVNLTLTVGSVNQQVEVTGTPPTLETASATIGQVVGSQQVVDLPLNGRQFTELALLTPGAAPKEGAQQAFFVIPIGGGGISPSVNGQVGRRNFYTLDGMMNDALFTDTWAISPPPDAIQEFKVQSHIVDAQFGVSSGANINVATKSGGPLFHGDIWEFLRNDKLDAANFFDNATKSLKPPFRQNQYGVTAGGPLWIPDIYDGRKKQTYIFGYWEGFRSRQSSTAFGNVPTPAQLNGDFTAQLTTTQIGTDCAGNAIFAGEIFNPYTTNACPSGNGFFRQPFSPMNVIPSNQLNQAALLYLNAFYPTANFGTGGFPNYTAPLSTPINSDQFGIRVDHTFHNNDTLYGVFYFSEPTEIVPTIEKLGQNNRVNLARGLSVGYTHLFSPTTLLNLHYSYTWTRFGQTTPPAGVALLQAAHLDRIEPVKEGLALVPQVSFSNGINGTAQFAIPLGPIRSHMLSGDFQKVFSKHTLSAGLMIFHVHAFSDGFGLGVGFDTFASASSGQASSTGNPLASMLLDLPANVFGFIGNTEANNWGNWYGGYIQDKWQASKKLSIQFGMRYDFVQPMRFARDQISGADLNGSFLISQPFPPLFPFRTVRRTYFDPQYHGFQPRLGIAYSLTPKTVIRTGFAIFDDNEDQRIQTYGDPAAIRWPWGAGITLAGLNQGVPNTFFDSLPLASTFFNPLQPSVAFGADPRAKIPYVLQWNFGVQRELTPNLTAEVDYVGSGSRKEFVLVNFNEGLYPSSTPLSTRLPFPQYGAPFPYDTTWGTGNYDGLQVKVDRRFSQGLSFLASYTWSHCLDLASEGDSGIPVLNFYNRKADYGNCDFDFRHVFTLSSVYELPVGRGKRFLASAGGIANAIAGGWRVSGILRAQSGFPFTCQISFDNANIGVGGQRCEQVGNPFPPGFKQSVSEWYNIAAFQIPAAFTLGNVGRNTLRGPRTYNIDTSFFKDFNFTESRKFEFRADFFNLLNHPQFASPGIPPSGAGPFGGPAADLIDGGTEGQILAAAAGREIQFSLKFLW